MARVAKPAEQRHADGNPRQHEIPDPLDIGECLHTVPDPPMWLGPLAGEIWHELGAQLVDVGSLRTSDLLAFEALCEAGAQMRLAGQLLHSQGLVTSGSKGQDVAHPAIQIWRGAQLELRQWCNRFGLDPSSRTARGAEQMPGDDDPGGDVVALEVVSGDR